MHILAAVPCYEESDIVGETVQALSGITSMRDIVVIDDASSDGTARRAALSGARVVAQGENLGKGGSLNRVLAGLDFDLLLMVDGDLGRHASEARKLLEPVVDGVADLAIAAFPPPSTRGGFGFAQGLARWGIARLGGVSMRSPLSGQRAMTRDAFSLLAPFDGGFGVEVGMTIDALRAGLRVVEVETAMSHRETARDFAGFVHRGRQFGSILAAISRRAARPAGRSPGR